MTEPSDADKAKATILHACGLACRWCETCRDIAAALAEARERPAWDTPGWWRAAHETCLSIHRNVDSCQQAEERIARLTERLRSIVRVLEERGDVECLCQECEECGKMPTDCSGTECAQTCQCSMCGYCIVTLELEAARSVLP